jgi:hypothetical protein
MTPRQQRRFREQFRKQVEQERNGAPIPPEIAALMTKPKEQEILHQIVVTVRATKKKVALGPMMSKDACGLSAEAINRQITLGQRWDWIHAEIVPMTPISQGAH